MYLNDNNKGWAGQKRGPEILGKDILRTLSAFWIVFVLFIFKMTPSLWKTTASLLKWRARSNSFFDGTKRFELRKMDKKASKQGAQKLMSELWPKFNWEQNPCKIDGVMGDLGWRVSPKRRFAPRRTPWI